MSKKLFAISYRKKDRCKLVNFFIVINFIYINVYIYFFYVDGLQKYFFLNETF